MIDDSNGMAEQQGRLAAQMPRLLEALGSGDLDGDGIRDRPPFTSIHLGVVTSDMGVQGVENIPTCEAPLGDDGLLQTAGHGPGCEAVYPSFLDWEPGGARTGDEVATDLVCLELLGIAGCGFEQPLEAPLKALSPSMPTDWTAPGYVPPTFYAGLGHGDRENAGFVRRDSILAVVILTDEDDSTARDPSLYDPSSTTYTGPLNTRVFNYPEAVQPVERYVDGLLQLRRHPSRLAFLVIAGIPVDILPDPGAPIDWDRVIGDPSVRDPRMVETLTADRPKHPDACRSMTMPMAATAPPRRPVRIVTTAHHLAQRGARVSLGSICLAAYDDPITSFLLTLR